MAHRSPRDQQAHDQGVLAEAQELDGDGWDVQADHIEGHQWSHPPTINGHQPDIYATKGGQELVVEIETDTGDDESQRRAFQSWADQGRNREFYWRVVDRNGNRGRKRN